MSNIVILIFRMKLLDVSGKFWKLGWKRKGSGIFGNCKAYLEDFGNWSGRGRGAEFLEIVGYIWKILEIGMEEEEEWNF